MRASSQIECWSLAAQAARDSAAAAADLRPRRARRITQGVTP
jgi:hypothetical protein